MSQSCQVVKVCYRGYMTTSTKKRPWTEDEISAVSAGMTRRAAAVAAEIGRPVGQVYDMRRRIQNGWSRQVFPWTPEEDELLRDPMLDAPTLARRLPGRTPDTIAKRRQFLGVLIGNGQAPRSPFAVANRPLLAKTCTGCGLLLPSGWFSFDESRKRWRGRCRKCCAGGAANWRANNPEAAAETARRNLHKLDLYEVTAEAVTRRFAVRRGMEYTEADYEVLADPGLTVLAKALKLERTYGATSMAARAAGFKSHRSLGDPARDQWIIDNPNLPRVQEIKAALEAATRTGEANTAPAWDWDD